MEDLGLNVRLLNSHIWSNFLRCPFRSDYSVLTQMSCPVQDWYCYCHQHRWWRTHSHDNSICLLPVEESGMIECIHIDCGYPHGSDGLQDKEQILCLLEVSIPSGSSDTRTPDR